MATQLYKVKRKEDGSWLLEICDPADFSIGSFVFGMEHHEPQSERERFDQMNSAALHATKILRNERIVITWMFNAVELNTNMQDAWSAYTELTHEMAN